MTKVIILSYFFPPNNYTPSNRINSWAKDMHKHGIYPIIITRKWDESQDYFRKDKKNSNWIIEDVEIEKTETYEVHRVPQYLGFANKYSTKKKNSKFISKFLNISSKILEYFTLKYTDFNTLDKYTKYYLSTNKNSCNTIITSGFPFLLFKTGADINKKYKIKWIADYRDEWSTEQILLYPTFIGDKIIRKLDRIYEKLLIKNVTLIVTVNDHIKKILEHLHNKPTVVISNGYNELNTNQTDTDLWNPYLNKITLLHSGTIYKSQDLKGILDSILELYLEGEIHEKQFQFLLLGGKANTYITETVNGYPELNNRIVFNLDRLKLSNALYFQKQSDAFLMLTHSNNKGISSSKIYDYMQFEKPIILFPNDEGEMYNIIKETGVGIFLKTKEEFKNKIIDLIKNKIPIYPNKNYIAKYSREYQTKILTDYIIQINNENGK